MLLGMRQCPTVLIFCTDVATYMQNIGHISLGFFLNIAYSCLQLYRRIPFALIDLLTKPMYSTGFLGIEFDYYTDAATP